MLLYMFLLTSDHFKKMSEKILSCTDMCPSTFQTLFQAPSPIVQRRHPL